MEEVQQAFNQHPFLCVFILAIIASYAVMVDKSKDS
jgi:hypothetical protein